LQRAYDEILHDVCIEKLPVVFAIDRAGLVGSDGETHQGIFDISYLSSIPHMTVLAPKNKWELSDMMKFAVDYGAPIAVRFPRGEAYDGLKDCRAPIEAGKCEWIQKGQKVALFALGSMVKTAEQVAALLEEKGIHCSVINARFAQPFDKECIRGLAKDHTLLVTMEENVTSGGMGEHIAAFLAKEQIPLAIQIAAIPDEFVEQGNVNKLKEVLRIDAQSIFEKIWKEVI
jgi:1-deoxy-D-xylulose-5-phosphate synthase